MRASAENGRLIEMHIELSRTELSYQNHLLLHRVTSDIYISTAPFFQRCLIMAAPAGNALPRDQYQHYIPRFILRYFQDAQIQPRYILLITSTCG